MIALPIVRFLTEIKVIKRSVVFLPLVSRVLIIRPDLVVLVVPRVVSHVASDVRSNLGRTLHRLVAQPALLLLPSLSLSLRPGPRTYAKLGRRRRADEGVRLRQCGIICGTRARTRRRSSRRRASRGGISRFFQPARAVRRRPLSPIDLADVDEVHARCGIKLVRTRIGTHRPGLAK